MSDGLRSWERQRPLEARWRLVVPDRRGFGSTSVAGPSDFEAESLDIASPSHIAREDRLAEFIP
jgi:pimeloyl-ACP methyl ester carboxylesterase